MFSIWQQKSDNFTNELKSYLTFLLLMCLIWFNTSTLANQSPLSLAVVSHNTTSSSVYCGFSLLKPGQTVNIKLINKQSTPLSYVGAHFSWHKKIAITLPTINDSQCVGKTLLHNKSCLIFLSASKVKRSQLMGDNGTLTVTMLNNVNMSITSRLNFFLSRGFKQISSGNAHILGGFTCAVSATSRVFCWGSNLFGQLGNNSTNDSSVPVAVNTAGVLKNKKINMVSAGEYHACATSEDGGVFCWGFNLFGQLGNNSTTSSSLPVAVSTAGVLKNKKINMVSAGNSHTCATSEDGGIFCWGDNEYGQLGNNSTTSSSVPVAVNTAGVLKNKKINMVSAGEDYACATSEDGGIFCWGHNSDGQLGDGTTTVKHIPVAVNTAGVLKNKKINMVSTSKNDTCATSEDGGAFCWGNNLHGQLGNNSTTPSSVPVAVNAAGVLKNKKINMVSAGNSHTCATSENGSVFCWGNNATFGQLGNNSTTSSSVPVAVSTSGVLKNKKINMVSAGGDSTCVTSEDGGAFCWGNNLNGQLGNNTRTISSHIPVPVFISDNYLKISAVGTMSNNYTTKVYFFLNNGKYARYDIPSQKIEYIIDTYGKSNWPGITKSDAEQIVAVVRYGAWSGEHPGKMYFFLRNRQYLRYDVNSGKVDEAPRDLSKGWSGITQSEAKQIVSAVTYSSNIPYYNDKMYFFLSTGQYIRVNEKTDKVDYGYPTDVSKGWVGITQDEAKRIIGAYSSKGIIYFFLDDGKYLVYSEKEAKLISKPKNTYLDWGWWNAPAPLSSIT